AADDLPFVRGPAIHAMLAKGRDDSVCACIDQLLQVLDDTVPPMQPTPERPFLARVLKSYSCRACPRVSIVEASVLQGRVQVGDEVEIWLAGSHDRLTSRVNSMEIMGQPLACAQVGDPIGLMLRAMELPELQRPGDWNDRFDSETPSTGSPHPVADTGKRR